MSPKLMDLLAEITIFNLAWAVLIILHKPIAAAAGLALLLLQIILKVKQKRWSVSIAKQIVLMGLCGILLDTMLTYIKVFEFEPGLLSSPLIPVWLMVVWLHFSFLLCYSLSWLQTRIVLACIMGCIFAPISYYSGFALGAVEFPKGIYYSLSIIAIAWAIMLPMLSSYSRSSKEVVPHHLTGET